MINDRGKPRPASHRAQISMTPEMFRGLRIMAAEQGTSVTALVIEAIVKTYPQLLDRKG